MKLACLTANPSKPCFVLHFKGVNVMLDCAVDIAQVLNFFPLQTIPSTRLSNLKRWTHNEKDKDKILGNELKECAGNVFVDGCVEFLTPEFGMTDLSEIDAILISNHGTMLALPYVTEYSNFKGTIYCTEPTLQIGRQYMEELVSYVEKSPRLNKCTQWKSDTIINSLPPLVRNALRPTMWKQCYTKSDINSCLTKVQMVGYNEKKVIYGALTVTACSSGYSIGSCNWIISSQYEKIGYIAGTSTLTTHPKLMDQAPLKNSDVLILSSLTQTPTCNPDAMIGEFCVNAAVTVKNGGNVLVPCYPSGITFDLFECLSGHLDSCGLSNIPLYFVSPVSDSSLAYSNIFGEWLSSSKQSRVYLPEPPFPHAELVSLGRLQHLKDIHGGLQNEYKSPCIVFTGHPSLRMGDVVHFIELWGKSSNNTILFTEPDFPYLEALAPYQPLQMKKDFESSVYVKGGLYVLLICIVIRSAKVCYCPIDTSLSYAQANKLIKELRPSHLVTAEIYTKPPVSLPTRTDLVIEYEPAPLTYQRGEVITLPVKRQFETLEITPDLASTIEPVEVKPGCIVSMVTAELKVKDNKYTLQPLASQSDSQAFGRKRAADGTMIRPKSYIWGNLNVQTFVDALTKQGLTDIKVEEMDDGYIIDLPNDDTLIQVETDSTHIICNSAESVRTKIRDTLLRCLQRI